jgi:hypothetical protein
MSLIKIEKIPDKQMGRESPALHDVLEKKEVSGLEPECHKLLSRSNETS